MSYLDLLKKLGKANEIIDIGLGQFSSKTLTQTDSQTANSFLPGTVSKRSNYDGEKFFSDGEALFYPQDLFAPPIGDNVPGSQAYIFFVMRDPNINSTAVLKRIGLYMPPAIKVRYGASWEEADIKLDQYLDLAQTGADAMSGKDGATNDAARALTDMGAKALDFFSGGSAAQQAASVKLRRTFNPQAALLFKNAEFREFGFDFDLLARSQAESDSIRKIIKTFKWAMHPGTSGENGDPELYLIYPNTFDIYLLTPSYRYMFNIQQCVLTSADVNYAGSNAATFFKYTGAPVDIRLSLQFKELSVLTKNLIEQDY